MAIQKTVSDDLKMIPNVNDSPFLLTKRAEDMDNHVQTYVSNFNTYSGCKKREAKIALCTRRCGKMRGNTRE